LYVLLIGTFILTFLIISQVKIKTVLWANIFIELLYSIPLYLCVFKNIDHNGFLCLVYLIILTFIHIVLLLIYLLIEWLLKK
jgi:hypothetical protein